MREILFRGIRWTTGEWVEGSALVRHGEFTGRDYIPVFDKDQNTFHMFEVIPESVGQFTGLYDKNGKKIFEGDIVRCGTGRICKVTFFISPGVSGFDLVAIGGFDAPPPHNWALFSDTEIIGNIHDNPELLGGEQS